MLAADGITITSEQPDVLEVIRLTSEDIGRRAAVAEIVLFELVPHQISLEETFMEMTRDAVEYHAQSLAERSAA